MNRSALAFAALVAFGHADEKPAPLPADLMPAGVYWTLDNRCIICHSDPSRDFGGLDMGHWTKTPDGGMGFVHLDAFKRQRPSKETFARVIDRLTTTDPDAHMPLGATIQPEELKPLIDWLESRSGSPRTRADSELGP